MSAKDKIKKLEEELYKYKKSNEVLEKLKDEYDKEADDYFSRIKKTIKYIENAQTLDYGTTKEFNIKEFPFVQHILEILKGSDK